MRSEMVETPELSVVIASINGWPYLRQCLAALARQQGGVSAEIIVADCVGQGVVGPLRNSHPEVRLLAFGEPRSVPQLRAAGILASRGEVIAITEDHCLPEPDWYSSMIRSHRHHPAPAVGGAVDNAATQRVVDWAVYFCEYSAFISPVPEGRVHELPGPNVSYKRGALEAMEDLLRDGYWETFLHWRLEAEGHSLWSDPSVRVLHKKHFTFRDFLVERYHYGRAFAGHRNQFSNSGRRWFHFTFSPLLPPLLITRIARRVLARRRHLGAFLRSLPLILAFMISWALGEWVGYAFGPGQSSLHFS